MRHYKPKAAAKKKPTVVGRHPRLLCVKINTQTPEGVTPHLPPYINKMRGQRCSTNSESNEKSYVHCTWRRAKQCVLIINGKNSGKCQSKVQSNTVNKHSVEQRSEKPGNRENINSHKQRCKSKSQFRDTRSPVSVYE